MATQQPTLRTFTYDEQRAALLSQGVDMPIPLAWSPFLKNRLTGEVYPWTDMMGTMSDKVCNAFNIEGSENEADLDPIYFEQRQRAKASAPQARVMPPVSQNLEGSPPMNMTVVPTVEEVQARYANGTPQVNDPVTPDVSGVQTVAGVIQPVLSDPTPQREQYEPKPMPDTPPSAFTLPGNDHAVAVAERQQALMATSETMEDVSAALKNALGDSFKL